MKVTPDDQYKKWQVTFHFNVPETTRWNTCDVCKSSVTYPDEDHKVDFTNSSGGPWGGSGEVWEAKLCKKCTQPIIDLINSKRQEHGMGPIEVGEFDW